MSLECPDHDIDFISRAHYNHHIRNECSKMLLDRNICFHEDDSGRKCKKSFHTATALIWHFGTRHTKYPCLVCGQVYQNLHELEAHKHEDPPQCKGPQRKFIVTKLTTFMSPTGTHQLARALERMRENNIDQSSSDDDNDSSPRSSKAIPINRSPAIRDYTCNICDKKLHSAASLRCHKKFMHESDY